MTIDGQEYVEVEYRVKGSVGDYKIRVIVEKQIALKLAENSSSEDQSPYLRPRLLVKG